MDEVARYERQFRRAGLPLLIEHYSARRDIFTRAVTLLQIVLLAEVLGAVDLDWAWWANLLAIAGGLALVLGALGVLNRARGRPFLARPRDVGTPELVGFVVAPALLPLVFGGQWRSALVTAAANALLLLLVYGVVGFGLLAIVRWAAARLLGQLAASLLLLTRALPLLMIFALVLMFTVETWEVFSSVSDGALAAIGAMFVGSGAAFLAVRLPREVRLLERDAGAGPPLTRPQRLNVGLVLFISQSLQVLVVALAIAAFFVALGMLAITPDLRDEWIGSPGHVILGLDLLGEHVELSEELLRVSGAIAAFSGLYYAIAVLTDSTYREEFLDEVTGQMRETFAVRAEYLKLRAGY